MQITLAPRQQAATALALSRWKIALENSIIQFRMKINTIINHLLYGLDNLLPRVIIILTLLQQFKESALLHC